MSSAESESLYMCAADAADDFDEATSDLLGDDDLGAEGNGGEDEALDDDWGLDDE